MPGRNVVELVLKAIDQASDTLKRTADEVKKLGTATEGAGQKSKEAGEKTEAAAQKIDKMGKAAQRSGFDMWNLSLVTTAAFGAITLAMERSIDVQQDFKNALLGLSSVAAGFGQDAEAAKQAAQELAADGLMTVADAATGLKNLLAAGFSLPQAITLMERFKDSAAFGRQAHLSFGEAIRSATEGIKNGNSILVDNAGVTKNLSIMLEEAGYSAQDLMRASQDAGVRMAIFNGILRETQHQVGDAARLAQELSGEMSRASVSVKEIGIQMGNALEPALRDALGTVTPLLGRIAEWIKLHPQLAASIGAVTAALLGLSAVAATLATFVIPALSTAIGFLATPLGIVVGVLGLLTAGFVAYKVATAGAASASAQLSKESEDLLGKYRELQGILQSTTASAKQKAQAQDQLNAVTDEMRLKVLPDLLKKYGAEELALDILTGKVDKNTEAHLKNLAVKAAAAQGEVERIKAEIASLESAGAVPLEMVPFLDESKLSVAEAASGQLNKGHEALNQSLIIQKSLLKEAEKSAEEAAVAYDLAKEAIGKIRVKTNEYTDTISKNTKAAEEQTKAFTANEKALTANEFALQKLDKEWQLHQAITDETADTITELARKKEYLTTRAGILKEIIADTTAELEKAKSAKQRDVSAIQQLELKLIDLKITYAQVQKEIRETTDEHQRQVLAVMQHEVAMHRMTADQQIEILRRLRAVQGEGSREAWELDEQLARIYSDRIKAELKEIEQAYNDQLAAIDEAAEAQTASLRRQMDDIDERTRRTIQGLQAILDAMDEQDRLRDREKARSEHEKRLADLLEKRRYHELRTGKEHVRAIAEIDAQIAEENQRWAEEQAGWEQDDRRRQIQEQIDHVQEQANIQKQALQDEIDRIQKNAAQQRKILQDHYKQVTRLTEEGIWDSIAAMAATNPKWFETGKQLIESLIAGIKSGQPQISTESQGILEAVRSGIVSGQVQAGRAAAEAMREPKYTIPPGQYEMIDGRAAMWARQLGGILGAGVTWDEDTRTVIIGGKQFTPLWIEDGRAYVSVRQVAEELGHRVEYDNFSGNIRIYHAGGYVEETGPALLEAGEYVLPKKAVSEISTFGNFRSMLKEAVEEIVNAIRELRPGIIVQGPLVNNDQVVLPAGTGHNWIDFITEGAETWLRGGK